MLAPATQQVAIAATTGLSQATVSGVVQDLQREGVLRVTGAEGERGNRVHLGNITGAAVGVDVGHQRVIVAARRVDATDLVTAEAGIGAQHPREAWMAKVQEMIKDLTAEIGLTLDDVISIGLGLPAAIDPRTAKITQVVATSQWDLTGHPATWFADWFPDVPVIPDNDANLAAYGEYLHGAGHDAKSMVYVKASSGIGAGYVAYGVIKRGKRGLAGELGHLTIDRNGVICRCGSRGCLETVAAGPRLLARVREAYEPYGTTPPANLDELITRARHGDTVCCRVLKDAARDIGFALALASNITDPETVVLGGTLGKAADMLIDPLTASIREYGLAGMFTHDSPLRIVGAQLGDLAGARGAMALGLLTEPPLRS
ncbi:ROK family protein [Actinocrispum wychmicini]|nr:ROK family protein [Actinocrispum wychmicini]